MRMMLQAQVLKLEKRTFWYFEIFQHVRTDKHTQYTAQDTQNGYKTEITSKILCCWLRKCKSQTPAGER